MSSSVVNAILTVVHLNLYEITLQITYYCLRYLFKLNLYATILTLIIRYCNHMLIQDFFREKGVNFCLENTDFFFYSETTIGQDFYLEK